MKMEMGLWVSVLKGKEKSQVQWIPLEADPHHLLDGWPGFKVNHLGFVPYELLQFLY